MPEREFFKFGDEVEEPGFAPVVWTYVGPMGREGEHILFNPEDGKAYRTRAIGDYQRRRPRKGELWARDAGLDHGYTVTPTPVLVVHADEHFVVFTADYRDRMDGSPRTATHRNLFSAKETRSFTAARKRVEDA